MSEEYLKLDRDYKTAMEVIKEMREEYTKQWNEVIEKQELIDKIKETIRENPIDYALATEVIIEINNLIKEYEV